MRTGSKGKKRETVPLLDPLRRKVIRIKSLWLFPLVWAMMKNGIANRHFCPLGDMIATYLISQV
jgi:hypothetical protein